MSAPVNQHGACPDCRETVRHKPLCPQNLVFIETEMMDIQHMAERLAARQRLLKNAITEVRQAKEAEAPQLPGWSERTQAILRSEPTRRIPPGGEPTQQFQRPDKP